MKAIRWLLCHLVAIILITAVVLLYSFRDELENDFDRMVGNTPKVSSENKKEQPATAGSTMQPAKPAEESPSDRVGNVEKAGIDEAAADPAQQDESSPQNPWRVGQNTAQNPSDPWNRVLPEPVVEQQQDEQAKPEDSRFPPEDYDPETSGSQVRDINAERQLVEAQIAGPARPMQQQPGEMDRMESAPASEAPAVDKVTGNNNQYASMLTEARRLYWDGQSRRARGVYEKLMFDFPKQPEAPAELGNLLMQSGNLDAAVWAYQNAIERYLNLQREQEAITLVDSISRIDPAIAESLQKKYW
jgi:tetratricopeptide (TPR) repeat protein